MIGTKLAHYRILKKIGEGGMGDVYVAEDERLKRNVALKILNDDSAMDRTRSARFHRETKAAAAINHPNVVTLYAVEESEGRRFLAMEWVEGETLSEVLPEGTQLSMSRFLDYAIPLVEGVKAAHDLGIAHRDLKPRNVMIDKDGRVKLLDFGLARWRERDRSHDPERTDVLTLTQTGAVLGTPAYMSPEQLRGRGVDQRTDLFSIGVLFYEMLAGSRPFRGATPTEMATSILRDDPPRITTYRTDLPRRVQRLLERCLQKKTEDRYQSADELLVDLKELLRESQLAELSASLRESPAQRRFHRLAWTSILLVPLLIVALLVLWWRFGGSGGVTSVAPQTTTLVSWIGEIRNAQLSPDGDWVSFLSSRNGPRRLYLQRVQGGGEPRVVESARASVHSHLWSPDGEDLAVLSRNQDQVFLLVTPAFGGAPKQSLALPASHSSGDLVRWIGSHVYLESVEGLHRLDLDSEELTLVLSQESEEGRRYGFDVSPDEEWVVFLRREGDQFFVWRSRIDASRAHRITEHAGFGLSPRFFGPDGESVAFASTRGGRPDIWSVNLQRTRRPRPLSMSAAEEFLDFTSHNESILLIREVEHKSDLHLVNGGELQPATVEASAITAPSVDAAAETVAFTKADPRLSRSRFPFGSQIFVSVLDGSQLSQMAMEVDEGAEPKLSPDGRFLAYWRDGILGRFELVVRELSTHQEQLLTGSFAIPAYQSGFSAWSSEQVAWSPDSRSLYFVSEDASGRAVTLHRWREGDGSPVGLWSCPEGKEIGDLHVSPLGGEIAFLVSNDYIDAADGSLVRFDVENGQSTAQQLSGDLLRVFGWWGEQRLVVGSSTLNSDFTEEVEVFEAVPGAPLRPLGELSRTKRGAVLLSDGELLFPGIDESTGVYNLHALLLSTGQQRQVTANDRPGVRLTGVQRVGRESFLVAVEEPWSSITLLSLDSDGSHAP